MSLYLTIPDIYGFETELTSNNIYIILISLKPENQKVKV